MLEKVIAGSMVAAIVALWVLLVRTSPASTGPLGILAVFVLMYVSALGVLTFLLFGTSTAIARLAGAVEGKAKQEPLSLRKAYYYASVVALAPVMLVAMQSVHEVGFYQLLLVLLFVIIGWVYITKRTA